MKLPAWVKQSLLILGTGIAIVVVALLASGILFTGIAVKTSQDAPNSMARRM